MRPDAPQTFRWRLAGPHPFPLTRALLLGEATHAAVQCTAALWSRRQLPEHRRQSDHEAPRRAFYLPEDADEDALIDHVTIFAEAGLPDDLVPLLAQIHEIRLPGIGRWELVPDGIASRRPGALFGPSRRWISVTPFLAGRWHRGERPVRQGEGLVAQLRAELTARPDPADPPRPLPPPQQIDFGPVIRRRRSRPIPAAAFDTWFACRDRNAGRPADATVQAAELTFAAPVRGPLALGFGAQFGLGLFEPADDLEPAEVPKRTAPPALQGGEAAEA